MLIGASLKMYFSHARTREWVSAVEELLDAHPARDAVTAFVLPQYPSIPASIAHGGRLLVGAQDVAAEDRGPFTGEVSAEVLAELGCRFVEVGHAERRRLFGDTEEVIAAKVRAALRHVLIPIICVGEAERVDADGAAQVCIRQVRSALEAADAADVGGEIVIAYEPVWAIGAPEPADPAHIRGVCGRLRTQFGSGARGAKVIYGGSAGPGLLSGIAESVDGLFLGRFAHDPAAVRDILDEVDALTR
ncbi:triosephosphate isomerase [Microbacterium sp. CBA3102]|uniref:triose-phosphate isomerase family protein n=1 Tax=Microbacterium sp. CBA3102 TaxID=2603598 RepID=UPI0011BB1D16|nr:triose-phosphate isomerase family protein [Microbacterium sp. CBA3102]QEA27291.1 triosephosphate isomerase [Microbacterium sp. CBA3102]